MLVLHISTKPTDTIMNLDHVTSIDYKESLGELVVVVGEYGRSFYVDKGTPESAIFNVLKMALSPIYEPRSLQTHGVQLRLDLRQFQKSEDPF